jgi:hypothetical protein
MTMTTDGRQHNEATNVEPAMYFHNEENIPADFTSASPSSIFFD